jgi:hypothetical protein
LQRKQWTKEQAPAATKSLVRPNAQNREAETDRYLPERYGLFSPTEILVWARR